MAKKLEIRDMVYSALFATIIAVSSYITIPLPISPVPITAQGLAVMLAGCVLTPVQAALSMVTFLFMGAIGIPVFSGGTSGIGVILGKTGGYLIGYLIGVIIISLLVRKNKSLVSMLIACFIGGIVVVHILGSAWLGQVTSIGIKKAFLLGSAPFIPGDIIKAVVAVLIGKKLSKSIKKPTL
ncbi:biotin transporter BioY [Clostridium sporogenes]|uniref:Biotin transporter n=1 Tax=Clostridium botulinum TaxID=1491 RepID=A0A6M0T248_CLOBO|nr:biotin transporter BioY [Clostridium sporogenes]NFA61030.1 biotin transporter BioY [Clostridium botulinum]NFI73625.1 biotin transporter BioY [Clostridium sporogenes]NFL72919.1 biotin transporter BioY [Clostridium sporogenes]NFM25121.1 biotin transporter BioY [Clostridium sporogenes]NFP61127.1 biotin transporter BioY [Clostridium sporogenes]